MGRPANVKPSRTGTSRRDFLKRSGASTATLMVATQLLPLQAEAQSTAGVFAHGVASGDPLPDRVILWTRVTPAVVKAAIVIRYAVASDPAMTQIVLRGSAKTNPARDYTVKVDAIGLQPHTTYYYQFAAEGATSPVGRTRTLPSGTAHSLRMAVVSCSNHAYGYFNVYGRIAQRADLDLVLHLGDYLYEYGAGQYGTARTPEPPTEIVTLADYRQRHAQYKRDADSQAMHRQHPIVAIWDDHETANNSWRTGAQNHQPATEGEWDTRVAMALQAYYEWMPVRPVDTANLRMNNRYYAYGDLADLIMLEERLNGRSEQLLAATRADAASVPASRSRIRASPTRRGRCSAAPRKTGSPTGCARRQPAGRCWARASCSRSSRAWARPMPPAAASSSTATSGTATSRPATASTTCSRATPPTHR